MQQEQLNVITLVHAHHGQTDSNNPMITQAKSFQRSDVFLIQVFVIEKNLTIPKLKSEMSWHVSKLFLKDLISCQMKGKYLPMYDLNQCCKKIATRFNFHSSDQKIFEMHKTEVLKHGIKISSTFTMSN